MEQPKHIKAIIGLGNPGAKYAHNRHSIGFCVVDALAERFNGTWESKSQMLAAEITINNHKILLVKPQTFMNSSGKAIPFLQKQGIKAENMIVVHDELEKPFGSITLKHGGSHKGHNGLKSIISVCGLDFWRLRFGIGRPPTKEEVPVYVLENFKEPADQFVTALNTAIDQCIALFE